MKLRKVLVAALVAALLTGVAGCSGEQQPVEEGQVTPFPISSYDETLAVTLGDVMPFYDGEVLNIYHLQNSRGSQSMYYHPISRLTTTDFVHYEDRGVAISYEEKFSSPDAALGTGSFIKDEDGLYHCFYTGHNAEEGTGLPYIEVVRHATSPDQVTWTKDEDFNLYGTSNDFRDPYVYYDDYDECYYMLVTTNQDGRGVIKRYSSPTLSADDSEWSDRGVFFANDSGTFNMECPSYVEYNGCWYLMYSEQGDNRVSHYRYRTEHDGDWYKFERDTIDASGFYAGRLEFVGEKLYAFAWCATLTAGSVGDFDWGGNLVVHELRQLSDGELCAVPVTEVGEIISAPAEYTRTDGEKAEELSFIDGKFAANTFTKLSGGTVRITFDITLDDYSGDCGMTFGIREGLNNRLGNAVVAFEPENSRLVCYNDVSSIVRYGSSLAQVPFAYMAGRTYGVTVLISGEIISVYLDDAVVLTLRLPDMKNNYFAFYSNGAGVTFGGITFYE